MTCSVDGDVPVWLCPFDGLNTSNPAVNTTHAAEEIRDTENPEKRGPVDGSDSLSIIRRADRSNVGRVGEGRAVSDSMKPIRD